MLVTMVFEFCLLVAYSGNMAEGRKASQGNVFQNECYSVMNIHACFILCIVPY